MLVVDIWLSDEFNPSHDHQETILCSRLFSRLIETFLGRTGSAANPRKSGPNLSEIAKVSWERLIARCVELACHAPSGRDMPDVMQAHLSLITPFSQTIPTYAPSSDYFDAFMNHGVLQVLCNCMRLFSRGPDPPYSSQLETTQRTERATKFGEVVVDAVYENLSRLQFRSEVFFQEAVSENVIGCFEQFCLFWIQSSSSPGLGSSSPGRDFTYRQFDQASSVSHAIRLAS